MKKTIKLLFVAVIAIVSLAACDNGNNSNPPINNIAGTVPAGSLDNSFIEEFTFSTEQIEMQSLTNHVQGVQLRDNRIYYWYADSEGGNIYVTNMELDGSDRQTIQIPAPRVSSIAGLQIREDGNIEFFYSLSIIDTDSTIFHGMYIPQDNEIIKIELPDELLADVTFSNIIPNVTHFNLRQAIFAEQENIALVVSAAEGYAVLLLDRNMELTGQVDIAQDENLLKLYDGRVVVWGSEADNGTIREINFETGDIGEESYFIGQNFRTALSAGGSSIYDLLLFDGTTIVGYELSTATATPLFNWFELNLGSFTDIHIEFLQDGRLFVLYSGLLTQAESFILMQISRDEVTIDPVVITVGGAGVSQEIRNAVTIFNRENQEFQIEIKDYGDIYGWEAAQTRFNIDMIAGRGPDIIVGSSAEEFENTEFLICLYGLIDSDPELSREDFLPGVLSGFESRDGRLQFISSSFRSFVYFSHRDVMEQVGELTLENVFRWLDESDSRHLGPDMFNRYWLVEETLLTFSDEFIDWENNVAHIDNPAFINLLNLAATLPERYQFNLRNEVEDWNSGRTVFFFDIIGDIYSLQTGVSSPDMELIFLGMPFSPDGQHEILAGNRTMVSISAASDNIEAAWHFIRQFLTRDGAIADFELPLDLFELPLRIDVLEELIDAAMTPEIVDGVEVPRLIDPFWGLGSGFWGYAMTEEEATEVMEIITNTSRRRRSVDTALRNIITESLQPFFADGSTAEDTARVLQSRVSIFLAERA